MQVFIYHKRFSDVGNIRRGNSDSENIMGGCLVKSELRSDGWPKACDKQTSTVPGQQSTKKQWSRYPGKCIDVGAKSSSQCDSIAGQWLNKSFTENQCIGGKPQQCTYRNGNWNAFSPAECSKCQGTMGPAYNWNAGLWKQAEMVGYRWMQKKWQSRNQWYVSALMTNSLYILKYICVGHRKLTTPRSTIP